MEAFLLSFFPSFFFSLKRKANSTCRFAARHHQVDSRHNRSDESASAAPKGKIKKKQQHTNQRLCARIPTSHPNKSWEPPVALEASHLHRPTRVTGCDRTSKTPPASPRPPPQPTTPPAGLASVAQRRPLSRSRTGF